MLDIDLLQLLDVGAYVQYKPAILDATTPLDSRKRQGAHRSPIRVNTRWVVTYGTFAHAYQHA